jgi:hypothetical protein
MMNPTPDGANPNSLCKNNVAGMISGYRGGKTPDEFPIPGDHSHNWNGYYQEEALTDILNDIVNRDFRPVSRELLIEKGTEDINSNDLFPAFTYIDSVYDIGAYEYGDTIYPIAGRRETICSHPIPFDGGESASGDVMLAWRPAFMASGYRVYVGENFQAVKEAGPESPEFKGEQEYNTYIPGPIYRKEQRFWRVDALVDGAWLKGDVWSFSAMKNANGADDEQVVEVTFIVSSEEVKLEGAAITMEGVRKLSSAEGIVLFDSIPFGGPYGYQVEKEGFEELSGTLSVDADTTLQIELRVISGMAQQENQEIRVYPNPARDQIHIYLPVEAAHLEVIDMYGRVVELQGLTIGDNPVKVSQWIEGKYLFRISDHSSIIGMKKIIIIK